MENLLASPITDFLDPARVIVRSPRRAFEIREPEDNPTSTTGTWESEGYDW